MDLPPGLRAALDAELRGHDPRLLARATAHLSEAYRAQRTAEDGPLLTIDDIAAYAAYRLPATFAALVAALREVRDQWPGELPRTLLDAGAGPGTALWAAREIFPELERGTLLERDPRMIAFGQRLAAHATSPLIRDARWQRLDLSARWEAEPHDLVVMAYVLNEIPEERRAAVVDALRSRATGGLLLLEPGTPAGFAVIREARRQLLATGATVLAPCPHDADCPLPAGDWCHFAQRVTRSRVHRVAKGGTLGYEDEKFSYVAVAGTPAPAITGRVIRHPRIEPGRITLQLCTPDGLRTDTIARGRDRAAFRLAHGLRWGDALLPEEENPAGQ
jgi:ribosomal protein RSM22 (predicted rRNA methylase)